MYRLEESLYKIRENKLSEVEASSLLLKETDLKPCEVYKVCLLEFKSFNKRKLRTAILQNNLENLPTVGHYDEHGITILPSEED